MFLRRRKYGYAVVFLLAGIIMGLVISSGLNLHTKAYTQEPGISKEAVDILSKTGQAMAEVAAAVKPAVVNISSTRTVKMRGAANPFFNDPFFKQFFGDEFRSFEHPREHKQASLGSGVIVDGEGYIITNNHVVKDADEIKIKLSDKREFRGKVVGTDPKTDLAIIKIDAHHLPVLKWGNSDTLKVGETVIAVGSPYGLSQTITSGIVSATGRANVGIADYEDFIQTDAAINPGNSGGALVNVRGELIGINTAIFSTSGGYQGVGFAIPSSMAKVVMENLVKNGKVVRGWLGISIQPVTPELAKQFSLKDEKGVLVGDVVEESPAEKAGFQRGDVIVEFDGREVSEASSFRNTVAATPVGREVAVKLLRDGKSKTVKVTIAELSPGMQGQPGSFDNMLKGLQVRDITAEMKRTLDIPRKVTGVIITDIDESSPASGMLAQNDVILEVNKKRINNLKDYEAVVSKIPSGHGVLLLIYRNGSTIYLTLNSR
jgi:serine protease Do